MKQIIIGGYDALSNAATRFNTVSGGSTWSVSEDFRRQVVTASGKLKSFFVELSEAPGVGTSYTLTLMKQDVAQSLAVTISGTGTTGSDTVNEISVSPGDVISLRSTYSGSPTTPIARWSMVFEGDSAGQSLILGTGECFSDATHYVPIMHGYDWDADSEEEAYQVIPTPGTIKNLYVESASDVGWGATDGYSITLRRGGVSTTLTTTILYDDHIGNDTTHEIHVDAGDLVCLMVDPINAPNDCALWFGMMFVPDTDGESLLLGQSSDPPSTSVVEYNQLVSTYFATAWSGTENLRFQGGQVMTLKKLYAALSVAPGVGKSYQIRPRVNGADSGISVTISDNATSGNDVVNTKVVADFDDLGIACTPDGTPAAVMVYWGIVCYISGGAAADIQAIPLGFIRGA